MRIKRFRARDVQTALRMVKEELGPDAVILSTRELKDGNEPAGVEVTAGIGYEGAPNPRDPYGLNSKKQKNRETKTAPAETGSDLRKLEGGLKEIKDLLLDMTHREGLSEKYREQPAAVRLYRGLTEADLDPAIARTLVERAADVAARNGGQPAKTLQDQLVKHFKALHAGAKSKPKKHIAIVGPSGVGKTTTLAKLAAYYNGRRNMKAALISLDGFRLGAAEQIRTYARIMGLPVRVAGDRQEFFEAIDLFEDMDRVLIDTSGRALNRPEERRELSDMFADVPNLEVMLVLSALTKDRDLAATIKRAGPFGVSSLVVSKIDETQSYGNVVNNLLRFKLPVSFMTNGQKVPDDLVPATPVKLAALITTGFAGENIEA
jgi:flagellar biosynthesis protein FlhF